MKRRGWIVVGIIAIPGLAGGLIAYGLLRLADLMDRVDAERRG